MFQQINKNVSNFQKQLTTSYRESMLDCWYIQFFVAERQEHHITDAELFRKNIFVFFRTNVPLKFWKSLAGSSTMRSFSTCGRGPGFAFRAPTAIHSMATFILVAEPQCNRKIFNISEKLVKLQKYPLSLKR